MNDNSGFYPVILLLMLLSPGCRDESELQQEGRIPLSVTTVSTKPEAVVGDPAPPGKAIAKAPAARGTGSLATTGLSATLNSSLSTRSAASLTSGSIGLFLVGTDVYAAQINVPYTCTSGTWSVPTGITPIYLYGATASVCAYYPYSMIIGDNPATTGIAEENNPAAIPLTSQLYSNASDLCYAVSRSVSSSSPSVSFTMERAYAKMTFTIIHDASYSGACAVSSVTIANAGIRSSNTIDITTGNYGSTTASGFVSVDPAIPAIASGSNETASVLMVPTVAGTTAETLSGNITFLFTVDGSTHAAGLPVSSNNLTTLAPGSNYQINVKISGSGLSVTLGSAGGSGSSGLDATTDPANCYMITPGGSLTFPVNVKGNGGDVAGTGLSVAHTAASAGLLWQTSPGLVTVSDFNPTNQTVKVTASPSATGNALIAAYAGANCSGDILWSWHIWVTDYEPSIPSNGTTYNINTNNPLTFMDRNLGATTTTPATVTTMGLLYQWGRKDPFPGNAYSSMPDSTYDSRPIYNAAGTLLTEGDPTGGSGINSVEASTTTADTKTLNLTNAIRNPMTFYYYGTNQTNISYDWYTADYDRALQNDALWGNADYTGAPATKTIFDPCPAGWRVPAWTNSYSPWEAFGTSERGVFVSIDDVGTWNVGLAATLVNAGYFPAAGFRAANNGALSSAGISNYCWSASPYNGFGFSLSVDEVKGVAPAYSTRRAHGFAVRCVRE